MKTTELIAKHELEKIQKLKDFRLYKDGDDSIYEMTQLLELADAIIQEDGNESTLKAHWLDKFRNFQKKNPAR